MQSILGLDIGTNSIGWALIEYDSENQQGSIRGLGSRIIPMDADLQAAFETGQAASKNAQRRQARGARRLKQRFKQRRKRLIEALKKMGCLPETFAPGQRLPATEQRLLELRAQLNAENTTHSWLPYFLRHVGLEAPLTPTELAMVLLQMNQRRGFKSNRKANNEAKPTDTEAEEETQSKRRKTISIVEVTAVNATEQTIKGNTVFEIVLADGRRGTTVRRQAPPWLGNTELEITEIPPTKKAAARIEFRTPDKSDWQKKKETREAELKRLRLHPGSQFFYEIKEQLAAGRLAGNRDQIIDRQFYYEELQAILQSQEVHLPFLTDEKVKMAIIEQLYPNNTDRQAQLRNFSLSQILLDDIIYYQRPLKSAKAGIAKCRYLGNKYKTANGKPTGPRVAPSSSPVFQEFRIWQTINHLKISQNERVADTGKVIMHADVTAQLLTADKKAILFELFNERAKVSQKQIFKALGIKNTEDYTINFFLTEPDKELPGNETKALVEKWLTKAGIQKEKQEDMLQNAQRFEQLWHLLYSLDDEKELANAVAKHFDISTEAAGIIAKMPAFKQQYAALSAQAMKKMLPLMRSGHYWNWQAISLKTQHRIEGYLQGVHLDTTSDHTKDLFQKHGLATKEDFQGLGTAMAAYAVFDKHSETQQAAYSEPAELKPLPPNELRNPTVTQVVNETIRLVKDIWQSYGRPYEIHLELARELKLNAREREKKSREIAENERENQRIAALLRNMEVGNWQSLRDIEKVKLFENQANEETRKQAVVIKKPSEPTSAEIERYKAWVQQKFLSPYSGQPIQFKYLFSEEYQVDHIIPRSRFFDDSLENKVVVETRLNKLKDNQTAAAFIRNQNGQNGTCTWETYKDNIDNQFRFSRKKKRMLLEEDVPDGFIERQLNDTKYINRKLQSLLAPVAANQLEPGNKRGVVTTSGKITSELRHKWGLGEQLKELVKWRFERLEKITGKQLIEYKSQLDENRLPTGKLTLELDGFEKRIDHRHHAIDALVVACTTWRHIKYLNDLNRIHYRDGRIVNQHETGEYQYLLDAAKGSKQGIRKFKQPWPGFLQEAIAQLAGLVVSVKADQRIAGWRKASYQRLEKTEIGIKRVQVQSKPAPAVRQPLHKETFNGKITIPDYKWVSWKEALKPENKIASKTLRELVTRVREATKADIKATIKALEEATTSHPDVQKGKVAIRVSKEVYSSRVSLDKSFSAEKIVKKVIDKAVQKKLLDHLERCGGKPEEAFNAEGIEQLNKKLQEEARAVGKLHHPIQTVRVYEESAAKFEISAGKYVEAADGTNLFFIVYVPADGQGPRRYQAIPLRTAVEAALAGSSFVEEMPGYQWFVLSPNQLVYLPDEGEQVQFVPGQNLTAEQARKIYRFVSYDGASAFFVPASVASIIIDKVEFEKKNKIGRAPDGRMIKEFCIKLNVDRMGRVSMAKLNSL